MKIYVSRWMYLADTGIGEYEDSGLGDAFYTKELAEAWINLNWSKHTPNRDCWQIEEIELHTPTRSDR